jgi:hypothetical protein
MPAFQFRFDSNTFRNAFVPRKPRHPLLRIAIGLLGLGVLLTLVFVSVFVGVAMLAAGVLVRLFRLRGRPMARDHRIVDGQYRVIGKPVLPRA